MVDENNYDNGFNVDANDDSNSTRMTSTIMMMSVKKYINRKCYSYFFCLLNFILKYTNTLFRTEFSLEYNVYEHSNLHGILFHQSLCLSTTSNGRNETVYPQKLRCQ